MWRADSGGSDPPPLPWHAEEASRHRAAKRRTVVTVAVLALICVGVVTCVKAQLWRMNESKRYSVCRAQMSDLASAFAAQRLRNPKKAQRWSGSALWIAMRRDAVRVHDGRDLELVCPGDLDAEPADDVTDWGLVDLEHPPREWCSYAGRDFAAFPLDDNATEPQPIGACVHHRDGVLVAFDNGSVELLDRRQLGIEPGDEFRVGPESKAPVLWVLLGGN